MKVILGGTFDVFHEGHKALLRKAFSLGRVTIGLTSSSWAGKARKRKVRSFQSRKKDLLDFAKKEFRVKPRIVMIEDKFGPTLKEDFDYIVVSPETYPTAVMINQKRKRLKKKPMKIAKIKFVLGRNGKPLSATELLGRTNPVMKNSFEFCVRGVIRNKGRILLCRQKGKEYYFFPGGHVEYGEPAEKALRRELKEELDIKIKTMSFIGSIENIYEESGISHHEVNGIFDVSVDKVKDKSMEDHLDFFFLDKEEFRKKRILPLVLRKSIIKWLKDGKVFWASRS